MKGLITLFIGMFLILNPFYVYGQNDIQINARAALLMEVETGSILFQNNIDEQMEPASITKLMTYLLTMESVDRGEVTLEDRVRISEISQAQRGATYFLKAHEEVVLSELLEVMMIVSANDVATAIAEHVAGSVENFVKRMNTRAQELGLTETSFVNPNGMPQKPKGNMVTARDMGILASYIIKSYGDELIPLTDKESYTNPLRKFTKENTNGLLKVIPQVDGLKTGYTDGAGYCLISTMIVSNDLDDERDFRLVAIVLGTANEKARVEESKRLLEYGKNSYYYKKIVKKGEIITEVYAWSLEDYPMNLVAKEDIWVFGAKERLIKNRLVQILENRFFPVKEGEKLGKLELTLYNDEVLDVDLVSDRSIIRFPIHIYIKKFWMSAMGLLRYFLFLPASL